MGKEAHKQHFFQSPHSTMHSSVLPCIVEKQMYVIAVLPSYQVSVSQPFYLEGTLGKILRSPGTPEKKFKSSAHRTLDLTIEL